MESSMIRTALLCDDCDDDEAQTRESRHDLLQNVVLKMDEPRYLALLQVCLDRIPRSSRPVRLQTEVRLRKRGKLPGVVGLTTFRIRDFAPKGVYAEEGFHTITFYTNLLDRLSDTAVTAVMAHELAHAWLNEHLRPEASRTREEDADLLAEMWGFESELASLASETDPLDSF